MYLKCLLIIKELIIKGLLNFKIRGIRVLQTEKVTTRTLQLIIFFTKKLYKKKKISNYRFIRLKMTEMNKFRKVN